MNKQLTFAEFVKSECKKRHISMVKMCFDLDIKHHTFINSYRIARTRPEWIVKIAKYFDADLEYVLLLPVKK